MNTSQNTNWLESQESIDIILNAFTKNGILVSVDSAEQIRAGKQYLNDVIQGMLTDGTLLYLKKTMGFDLVGGQAEYALPTWVTKAYQLYLLKMERKLEGTAFCSPTTNPIVPDGFAIKAFDDDLGTSCAQSLKNGWIAFEFTTDPLPVIQYVGIQSFNENTYTLVVEGSHDISGPNPNWQVVDRLLKTTYYPRNPVLWWAIGGATQWKYLRIREVGGATLNIAELHFDVPSNSIGSLLLGSPRSTAEWFRYPIAQPTQTPSAWTFKRTQPPMVTFFPPTLITQYTAAMVQIQGSPQNIDEFIRVMEFPTRYFNYIQLRLAQYVALAFNESKFTVWKQLADEEYKKLMYEDVESVPLTINFTNYYASQYS